MNATDFDSLIPMEERQKLISSHPLFNPLSTDMLKELASLSFVKRFAAKGIIVSQDEVVDAIYFVAEGEIEVDREVKGKGYCELVPQAIIREGETIGLNKAGFFSESGLRTATLISITECTLIGWDLDTFQAFLLKYPEVSTSMIATSEVLQRIKFIKQLEPFAELPKETLARLGASIYERIVPADTVLFRMDEVGAECYLISSGEVEVSITKDGNEKILATLTSPDLFGETALLTSTKRNATAKMTKAGKLLVIKKEQFDELTQHHTTAESMMLLSVERSRPIHAEGIKHYRRQSNDGQEIVILKDTLNRKYFQLSEEGWFIWQHLNGMNNLQDLAIELFKEKRIFCPEAIADTILNLFDAGFVKLPEVPQLFTNISQTNPSRPQQLKNLFCRISYLEWIFDDLDVWLTTTFNKGIYLLYTLPGIIFIASIILIGALFFGFYAPHVINNLLATQHWIILAVLLLVLNLFSVVIHEGAHAYTTKYFKHEVRRGGILLSCVNFIAYVDTSDMWLSNKHSKIIVSLAGPLADLCVAGVASIFALIISQQSIALFLWLLALMLYYSVFKNLNPLMENDGYAVLKDTFDYPNLREASFRRAFHTNPPSYKSKEGEIPYLILCTFFFVADVYIAYIFQSYLRLLLPDTLLRIPTYNLAWFLPALVVLKYILYLRVFSRKIQRT